MIEALDSIDGGVSPSMRRITVLCKGSLENLPPIMTLAFTLRDLGFETMVICSTIQTKTKMSLEQRGIRVFSIVPDAPASRLAFARMSHWLLFRHRAWGLMEREARDSMLWVGSLDTAFALGSRLKGKPYVLGVLELYDRNPAYLRLMKSYARQALSVVVPEISRAAILRVWLRLDKMPFVLPNKPYDFFDTKMGDCENERTNQILEMISGRRLILYQAQNLRMDVGDVARAVRVLGDDFVFGLLGRIRDYSMFGRLRHEYPDLLHFDYVPAPEHLLVTRQAYIGVLLYSYESLNNVFCAPNKLWEYSGFSVPMICNELPGLGQQLTRYQAGEVFRLGDVSSVVTSIRRIVERYPEYRRGADRLSKSVVLQDVVNEIIERSFAIKTY